MHLTRCITGNLAMTRIEFWLKLEISNFRAKNFAAFVGETIKFEFLRQNY